MINDRQCIRWTYTPQEWKEYTCKIKGENLLLRVWNRFRWLITFKTPEVHITPLSIKVGKEKTALRNGIWVKNIDLKEIGGVNIMSIHLAGLRHNAEPEEIIIPVPKGKLRDAMVVREGLLMPKRLPVQDEAIS